MSVDRREMLEKAFDEATETTEPVEPATVGQAPAQTAEPSVDTPSHEEKTVTPTETVDEVEKKAAEAREAAPKEEPAPQPVVEEIKAPVSLKAGEKEHWGKVPRPIQEAFARRERETAQALSTTAQARKFVDEFSKIVQPYAHLIQANNSTPLRSVENLMRTAAGLQTGDAATKADIVATIVTQYGIDVATLDNALSKRLSGKQQEVQPQAPPEWARPLFDLASQVQQSKQQREAQLAQEAEQAVLTVQDRPYFQELREDMADLMEMAAKRGVPMTIEQAYEKAAAIHPEASKVLAQRTKAVTVQEAARTLAGARKAASSVKGAPAGGALSKPTPTGRREAIEAAFEATGDR